MESSTRRRISLLLLSMGLATNGFQPVRPVLLRTGHYGASPVIASTAEAGDAAAAPAGASDAAPVIGGVGMNVLPPESGKSKYKGKASILWSWYSKLLTRRSGEADAVLLYPTFACRLPGTPERWRIHVRGWIFQPRILGKKRKYLVRQLGRFFRISPPGSGSEERLNFELRTEQFVVRNRKGRCVELAVCSADSDDLEDECSVADMPTAQSDEFGHFDSSILFDEHNLPPEVSLAQLQDGGPRRLRIRTAGLTQGEVSTRESSVFFVPERGFSVISDIDDTVKITEVGQYDEMLSNTLLRPFRVVEGMNELYQCWSEQGAAFHYVSSSPWQLQPDLECFFNRYGLPIGSFHLKQFDIRNSKFFNIFTSPKKHKPSRIEEILAAFPERRFVLVGDSGEKDPEIYSDFARAYPDAVGHIYIRRAALDGRTPESIAQVFEGLSPDRWTVFDDPAVLLADPRHRNISTTFLSPSPGSEGTARAAVASS